MIPMEIAIDERDGMTLEEIKEEGHALYAKDGRCSYCGRAAHDGGADPTGEREVTPIGSPLDSTRRGVKR